MDNVVGKNSFSISVKDRLGAAPVAHLHLTAEVFINPSTAAIIGSNLCLLLVVILQIDSFQYHSFTLNNQQSWKMLL